ncbi:hypothetical protein [Pseudonocardia sp. SID8383]|uniref:hypothetical protein n=1 Tax=Pseudonocardia sp. SID8383 TaxID=2690363 RepID=UPI0013691585|nr:hypothetical protein [Pseudonocardia sp. SID8383]MYW76207.1 hypothetical protein [Pseudonocardia sp. SID8383]
MTDESLADDYRTSVNAAAEAALAAEPEAQLTAPVKDLLESVAASIGTSLVLQRRFRRVVRG